MMALGLKRKWLFLGNALLVCSLAFSVGCGGDDKPKKEKKAKKSKKSSSKSAAADKGKKKGESLELYAKVPKEYRRSFKETDFSPDPSGDENRDPFASYVIREGGTVDNREAVAAGTMVCSEAEWVANDMTLRDLKLIGIVVRGTKTWAQFRDRAKHGHIVHRGSCVGKERATVEQIGDNFVRLKVVPDNQGTGAAPEPQMHDFALYPNEPQLANVAP